MKKFLAEWAKRLSSRKFLLAVVAALVVFGNKYFGWDLDEKEVWAFLAPLLLFIGVEGAADFKRA